MARLNYETTKKFALYDAKNNTITLLDKKITFRDAEEETVYDLGLAKYLQNTFNSGITIIDRSPHKNIIREVLVELDKIAGTFV